MITNFLKFERIRRQNKVERLDSAYKNTVEFWNLSIKNTSGQCSSLMEGCLWILEKHILSNIFMHFFNCKMTEAVIEGI